MTGLRVFHPSNRPEPEAASMRAMKLSHFLPTSALALAACAANPAPEAAMKKLTPILLVDAIEPALDFWTEGLGFQVTTEVPAGDALGFVILERDGIEVMLQTRASAREGNADVADALGTTCLYAEVSDLHEVRERLRDVEVLVPEHVTFYGATEVYLRAPGGHVLGLAEMSQEGE